MSRSGQRAVIAGTAAGPIRPVAPGVRPCPSMLPLARTRRTRCGRSSPRQFRAQRLRRRERGGGAVPELASVTDVDSQQRQGQEQQEPIRCFKCPRERGKDEPGWYFLDPSRLRGSLRRHIVFVCPAHYEQFAAAERARWDAAGGELFVVRGTHEHDVAPQGTTQPRGVEEIPPGFVFPAFS